MSTRVGAANFAWRNWIQLSIEFKRQWALTVRWFHSCFVLLKHWAQYEFGWVKRVCETHQFGGDTDPPSGIDGSAVLPATVSQAPKDFKGNRESILRGSAVTTAKKRGTQLAACHMNGVSELINLWSNSCQSMGGISLKLIV